MTMTTERPLTENTSTITAVLPAVLDTPSL
jgi:hypothetical protein